MSLLALAGAAAPYVMGGLGYMGQQNANEANVAAAKYATDRSMEDAQKNRDFQANMSNTAHQREVADLEAAGLNPLLSATGGSGAATPSGATGNAEAAKIEDPIGRGLSSAIEGKQLQLSMAKNAAELDSMEANRRLVDQQTKESRVRTKVHEKEIPKSDIINRGYKLVEPIIGKVEDALRSSSRAASRKTTKSKRSLLSPEHAYDNMGDKDINLTWGKP